MIKSLKMLGLEPVIYSYSIGSFSRMDILILKEISLNPSIGTIKLAEKVKLAPKNLIARLKKLIEKKFIEKSNIPAKPKGRIRVYNLTNLGKSFLEEGSNFEDSLKELESQKPNNETPNPKDTTI